ncbi:MAG: glycosyltransferase family 4 protein [Candidatus Aminicenantales bacterium]
MIRRENKKPKVLFYAPIPPPYAGPEVATSLLLNSFKGKSVQLIHIKSNIKNENWKKGIFDFSGIRNFFRVYTKFLSMLVRDNPDKVYFLLSASNVGFFRDAVIVFSTKLGNKKTIAHYRGGNFKNFYRGNSKLFQFLIRLTFKNIDCLIVQAEILKKTFKDLFPQERMVVLYNGVKLNNFFTQRENGDKVFTIFFMGHVAISKGFYELIQAFLRLRQKYRVRLLFAGEKRFKGKRSKSERDFLNIIDDFPYAHTFQVEQFISDFVNIADDYDAHYLGVIDDTKKAGIFKEADVFVLPSYTEGFSMSVLEAMAEGLPVIVTPVGAHPEILRDGVNGYFVQPGDIEGLVEKIERLILDREKARLIGECNRKYVAENFSIDSIAQEMECILRQA